MAGLDISGLGAQALTEYAMEESKNAEAQGTEIQKRSPGS